MITPERLFNTLYCRTNSESISRSERNRLKIDEDDFIYGEIEFASFVGVLEKLSLQSGGIFYDLGCGAGKAVLAAALNFDLSKSVGIELLPGLCEVANEKIQQAILILQSVKNELTDLYLKRLASIQIINADLHQCDIAEADIVFINATCFGYTNWEKIKEKLLTLKIGSHVIVTTKKIQHDHFQMVSESFELMSWGMNSLNIFKKIK